MDVSVVIVTRNSCELTCAAVRSVVESHPGPETETIVVDNGSTDGTLEKLRELFPGIQTVRSDVNLGFGRANNAGAKLARGKFILLLNSDARLQEASLRQAWEWMKAHPDCGMAGVQLLNPDGTRQNSIANYPSLATELLNKSLLRRIMPQRFPGKEHRFEHPTEVETVVGAFMLIRREVWDQVGGFDERYFFFFEETDLCLAIRNAGYRIMHLPGVQVWHAQGQSAKKVLVGARIEYWRSRYAYFEKNQPPSARRMLQRGLLVRLAVDWLFSSLMLAFTLGQARRWRDKWSVQTALWQWHRRGQPAGMGLPR